MNGGSSAKRGFRYQDWCIMYFLLSNYHSNQSAFEHLYCEQGKLDFEIFSSDGYEGYQVKSGKHLAARDINRILSYYSDRSNTSKKGGRFFYFVFSSRPINSLAYLISKISGSKGAAKYNKVTDKYINASIKDINLSGLIINYHCYSQHEIEDLVFSKALKILKDKMAKDDDVYAGIVDNFVALLRDLIDNISCRETADNRTLAKEQLEEEILKYLRTVKYSRTKGNGSTNAIYVEVKTDQELEVNIKTRKSIPPIKTMELKNENEGNPIK